MYEDGLKQIGKGEAYFKKVLAPLSGVTTENWTYKGLVFFPNIDNREALREAGLEITEDEVKVEKS